MQEKRSVFGVLLILSLFLLIPSESKALAEAVKTQANDYYIVVNGKEFKASRASVVLTSTFDAKKVMKDEYSINFYANKEKNIENEYLSVLCSENTNSILFNYNGTKLGDWSEVATTERSFFTYTKSKNLKKISTAGTFVQSDKNGGMGGYTYTTPWKSDFNNLNKRLVLVTESDNADSKTSVSEHIYSDQADYNQCVKDENPYCIKMSGNGGSFNVGSYVVMQTPSYNFEGVKSDGYSISLILEKNQKELKNYLSLSCGADMKKVDFTFVGDKLGVKDQNDPKYDKKLTITKIENKLKKIATKGAYKQISGSEWGGYTYTTPWKSTFNGLDKKLVLVSEVRKNDGSTVTAQYVKGGFSNYTKCLKSNMPFCFKKVGNKLVMFARIGYGSKIVNFWTK